MSKRTYLIPQNRVISLSANEFILGGSDDPHIRVYRRNQYDYEDDDDEMM